MLPEFDGQSLSLKLEELTVNQRFAFALSCCERLYPNYSKFSVQHKWGDSAVLREALDTCWRKLESADVTRDVVNDLILRCVRETPNTEDFSSIYVSPALDAATAVIFLLELALDDSVQKVVQIASLCRDTIDMYVQEMEGLDPQDPDLEAKILNHKFMQAELKRQREDHTIAARFRSKYQLAELMRLWKNPKKSNIGV